MASPKGPIWMTLAAASGTLVVVGLVLAGPAALRCADRPEGLFACMRGEIVEIGLLPEPPATPEVRAAPQPEPPAFPIPSTPLPTPQPRPVIVPNALPPDINADARATAQAGAGLPGATGTLAVIDGLVASAQAEPGRWPVAGQGTLKLPVPGVRAGRGAGSVGALALQVDIAAQLDLTPPAQMLPSGGGGRAGLGVIGSVGNSLAFEVEPDSEPQPPPASAPLAPPPVDLAMLRFASGKAIIRRGETLWAIARRVYGHGAHYRRIVMANPELRADPGRIFPGQVFDLPERQGSNAAH